LDGTDVEVASATGDRWLVEERLVALCPGSAVGFSVPRPPAEIVGSVASLVLRGSGVVLDGNDVTELFVRGADSRWSVLSPPDAWLPCSPTAARRVAPPTSSTTVPRVGPRPARV